MARFNRVAPIGLAVASGLVTCSLLYSLLGGQPRAQAASIQTMVVTSRAVDDSHALTAADLTVVQIADRPTGTFTRADELTGRLPLVPIPMGQPILTSHLAAPGALPGLWHQLTPGMRAVTVGINEVVGVGGFLKPGLRVDIIGVSQDGLAWESRTIAQDVPVLAIAQDDQKKEEDAKARVATSATLEVTPAQAESISLASERGRIRLVLRSPGDHVMRKQAPPKAKPEAPHVSAPARPAAPTIVYRDRPAPRPIAAYQPTLPPPGIEVIRGSQTEVVRP